MKYLLFILAFVIFLQNCSFHMDELQARLEFGTQPYEDRKIDTKKGNIRYLSTGNKQGPVLIFVHGSPGGWSAWKEYLKDKELRKQFYMISIDRIGYGGTTMKPSGLLKEQAKVLRKVVLHFKKHNHHDKSITLIAHSYGGPVVLKYASMYPTQSQALVLIASPANTELEEWLWYNKLAQLRFVQFMIPQAWNVSNFELKFLKGELNKIKSDWRKIKMPVLLIHGQQDSLVPVQNIDFIKKNMLDQKNLEIVSREDDNHFVIFNKKEFIKKSILMFLKNQKLVK